MFVWVTNVSTGPDLCIEFSTDPCILQEFHHILWGQCTAPHQWCYSSVAWWAMNSTRNPWLWIWWLLFSICFTYININVNSELELFYLSSTASYHFMQIKGFGISHWFLWSSWVEIWFLIKPGRCNVDLSFWAAQILNLFLFESIE